MITTILESPKINKNQAEYLHWRPPPHGQVAFYWCST